MSPIQQTYKDLIFNLSHYMEIEVVINVDDPDQEPYIEDKKLYVSNDLHWSKAYARLDEYLLEV